ncbi:MAG: DUF5686 and carboxypeptidase regulatory-like domain-containing protein [Bacteroidia bacterium]|nr:DUF5686 and carboxypeptidase regulatory-like domain-containing protein [Bacteroidia bacterium]
MRNFYWVFLSCFWGLLCIPSTILCQVTRISGQIIDGKTKEPLPFVNIILQGTTIGTHTDMEGNYLIETSFPTDTIIASFIGYTTQKKAIRKGVKQTIPFEFSATNTQLMEVVVKPGEDPAELLLRKILANKSKNSKDNSPYYQFTCYNKIEIDLNNFKTEKLKKNPFFKPFGFVFDNVDTSKLNGKIYLPAILSETVSEVYHRSSPKAEREIIKATRVSGTSSKSISQFSGNLYQELYIYDNYLKVFGKSTISPISDIGRYYYKYYLTDSMVIDGRWCYKLLFSSRRKMEPTFLGHLWIADSSFAVAKVEMKLSPDVNINWIYDFMLEQTYSNPDGQHWLLTKEKLQVDMNSGTFKTGAFATKSSYFTNFVFDKTQKDAFYSKAENIEFTDSANIQTKEFWDENRPEQLSQKEQRIYTNTDSVQKMPAYKRIFTFFNALSTGYVTLGPVEWGPYYTTYSFNQIEGSRIKLGLRTSNKVSKRFELSGSIAYGFKDERIKYSVGGKFFFSKKPRNHIALYYKDDMEQMGQSQNAFREDNLVNSLFRRRPFNRLTYIKELRTYYEIDWFQGFSTQLALYHREVEPTSVIKFEYSELPLPTNSLVTTDLRLKFRFAYREKYLAGEMTRVSLGTKYPVVQIQYIKGFKGLWNGQFNYDRLILGINQWFKVGPIGWSEYQIQASQIWGKLPYPLLGLHQGNEAYSYDDFAFNMMNYFEFVSDKYASGYYAHHFNGFFLNRIPLIRKLKWRELVTFRGLIGSLSESNRNVMVFPDGLQWLTKPYAEAGFGIENIFQFIRVDFLWRLSYLNNPNIQKFGVRFSLRFNL